MTADNLGRKHSRNITANEILEFVIFYLGLYGEEHIKQKNISSTKLAEWLTSQQ